MDPLAFGAAEANLQEDADLQELPLDSEPAQQHAQADLEPPPYHSVVLDPPSTSSAPTQAAAAVVYGEPHNPDFEITVSDPVKQGEGVAAHVSYKVASRVRAPGFRAERAEVIRRFRDFVWLQHRLRAQYRGVIVPALPEKNVVEKYKMTTEFIESRRLALSVFLRRVAAHPALRASPDLQLFLQASETEFAIEVSRAQLEEAPAGAAGGAKKAVSGAVRFLRELGHSAQSLYQRRSDDEEEDPEYLKVRAYVCDLERHLGEAHRQASRLVRHQGELGAAVAEFGSAMSSLGRYEEVAPAGVGDAFAALGERADAISRLCRDASDRLAASFEAPLKEFTRMVKAARKVMADRSAALSALQAARGDVDARRMRLAKLRGTPGIREEKVAEAERELNDAQHHADEAKLAYETIVQRMSGELDRFQRERSQEMSAVLRDFAIAEAQLSATQARLWRSLVPGLEGSA